MPLTPPSLERARVGDPVTAQAWNDLIKGVSAFYTAYAAIGHDYVQVNVRFREGPVPGARVVAVPLDGDGNPLGPRLEAAPAGGDGTEFRLPAISAGQWALYVQAPGFALLQSVIVVPPATTAGSVKTVDVEATATHLFVPEVVGLTQFVAYQWLAWNGFQRGVLTDLEDRRGAIDYGATVVLQGPVAGTARPIAPARLGEPVAVVNTLHRTAGWRPPSRTIVPAIVGWAEDYVLQELPKSFSQVIGRRTVAAGATGTLRVIAQAPPAGADVPAETPIDYTVDSGDRATVPMRAFAGTHPELTDRTALSVHQQVGLPVLAQVSDEWWKFAMPWAVVRRSMSDAALTTMRTRFAAAGAPISSGSGGLAAAWESIRVAAAVSTGNL